MPFSPYEKIALFGGTFDPVHTGHLSLAQLALRECHLDRVIFVPCARSPFKDSPTLADAEQRLAMLRLALDSIRADDWAEVSRLEIDRQPPSYSWETVRHYRERFPHAQFSWILGADQWEQIDQWAESEKLRTWLHFIVVTRRGNRVAPKSGWRTSMLEFDHPASATAIREGRGRPDWLPDSVATYIREQGLYGSAH